MGKTVVKMDWEADTDGGITASYGPLTCAIMQYTFGDRVPAFANISVEGQHIFQKWYKDVRSAKRGCCRYLLKLTRLFVGFRISKNCYWES